MRRNLFIALGVTLLIGGVGVFFLLQSLDGIVKAAIETQGSAVAGVPVRVDAVSIDLKEGSGTIRGLRVGNPDGFSRSDAIAFGEITLDLDVESLRGEPVAVEVVRIASAAIRLELNDSGGTNLGTIRDHVDTVAPAPKDAPLKGPRIVIRKLEMESAKLSLDARAMGGKESERTVPDVRLLDVGGSDGSTPDQLGRDVLRAVLRGPLESAVRGELESLAREELGDVADKAGGLLKKLID